MAVTVGKFYRASSQDGIKRAQDKLNSFNYDLT